MPTFRTLGSITLAVAVVVVALSLWGAAWVFLMLFGAVLLAIGLRAAAEPVRRHTPLGDKASVAVVVVALVALCAGVGAGAASTLSEQAGEMAEELPKRVEEVEKRLRDSELVQRLGLLEAAPQGGVQTPEGQEPAVEAKPTDGAEPPEGAKPAAPSAGGGGSQDKIVEGVLKAAESVITALGALLLVIACGLYMAFEPDLYVDGVVGLVPRAHRERARFVLAEIGENLKKWLVGQLFAMAVVGTLMGVGLAVLGVPMALLLGILSGLFDFIPNFGPAMALAPALLLADQPAYVVGLWALVQTLEGYVITPLVQKRAVDMPPVLLIGSQVVLSILLGPAALVTAAPLVVVAMVLVKRLYQEDVLGDPPEPAAHGG